MFPNARLAICGIYIKLERPAADSQYVELCNSGGEVDNYGRNKPVQRAWIVMPAYLAAAPDFFSLTRTEWSGDIALKIRDNIFKHLKEGTSSKMDDASSMSESKDAEMTSAVQGDPPVGGTPGGQSSGTGHRAAFRKAPPKALVTKEMMTSVRPKSPPNPPRSPKISSPPISTTETGNRWSSGLRTPRATIEEENAGDGGSAEVDDLPR